MTERYPAETLDTGDDDGTIVQNVDTLRSTVVGRKIISAEKRDVHALMKALGRPTGYWSSDEGLVLTLDNGTQVLLSNTFDCCAYTSLEGFWIDPASVEHVITGVGTTEGYTTWHIYADMGDIMRLTVGWSCGNPFYYGYGFDIEVIPLVVDAEVIGVDTPELEA
jgi:hypothetical protein